jgi:hypothetical protein
VVVPFACPYPSALFVRKAPIVEQPAQPVRGGTIDIVGDVRVEPDREHGIAVPETTLHYPGMLTAGDHERGRDVAEAVKVETRPDADGKPDSGRGRLEDPGQEAATEDAAAFAYEDEVTGGGTGPGTRRGAPPVPASVALARPWSDGWQRS